METASVAARNGEKPFTAAAACSATDPTFQIKSIPHSMVSIANTAAIDLGSSVEDWSVHAFLLRGTTDLPFGALLEIGPPFPEDQPWGLHQLGRIGGGKAVGVICRWQPIPLYPDISTIVCTVQGVCSAFVSGTGPIGAPLYADGPVLSFEPSDRPIATLLKLHREFDELEHMPNASVYFFGG